MTKYEKRIRRQLQNAIHLLQWPNLKPRMVRCEYCRREVFTDMKETVYVTPTGRRHACKGLVRAGAEFFIKEMDAADARRGTGHDACAWGAE